MEAGHTHSGAVFPLEPCENGDNREGQCVARLFANAHDIAPRNARAMPARYLELWDSKIRDEYCDPQTAADMVAKSANGPKTESPESCRRRLEAVSAYFNPKGPPADGKIGVALEGGGNKTAPFSLGVLAGLEEMGALQSRVDAIASVSGGTYAASFLFNRLLDKWLEDKSKPVRRLDDYDDWFRSCVPDEFADGKHHTMFKDIRQANMVNFPACGEREERSSKECNPFFPTYEYQGHVWMEPDLIMGNSANGLKAPDSGNDIWDPVANTIGLSAESLLLAPWQALSRTVFRWPGNSSPTKFAYTNGLERQYGYSPVAWWNVENIGGVLKDTPFGQMRRDWTHVWETHKRRMTKRTMGALNAALVSMDKNSSPAPKWIIGSSSPGPIGLNAWIVAESRDPIRHQFELTPNGYGSGIHGYANLEPQSGDGFLESDFLGPGSLFVKSSDSIPIVEAVVASAAFFDDNQSVYNSQPTRLVGGAAQHFLNITWEKEIPNFNASNWDRVEQRLMPYPLYFGWTSRVQREPYIHLQDGGNSENSGILPLLRRGYKTIIYAHGTQDDRAAFESVCHLKNHLEFDGAYLIKSPSLERLIAGYQSGGMMRSDHEFKTYLDQLCTEQMDVSDLAAFDDNTARPDSKTRVPAVAKLMCGRIGYSKLNQSANRTEADPTYKPCQEFEDTFHPRTPGGTPIATGAKRALPTTFRDITDLFYRWSGQPLTFLVYRGDALQYLEIGNDPPAGDLLSTIIAIVPSVSWTDVSAQLFRPDAGTGTEPGERLVQTVAGNDQSTNPWQQFCVQSSEMQSQLQIGSCYGPGDALFRLSDANGNHFPDDPVTPCTALAHILATRCEGKTHPDFPQDNFIGMTWNTTYTMFAAYFDLGRHQVWRAFKEANLETDTRLQSGGVDLEKKSSCSQAP